MKKKRRKKKNLKKSITVMLIFFISAIIIFINLHNKSKSIFSMNKNSEDNKPKNNISTYRDNNRRQQGNAIEIHNMLISHNYESKNRKKAYLTFDDGPSTTVTPKVLDILRDNKINATFFVIGSLIDQSQYARDILRREYNEGNTIGNHSYTHKYNILYPRGVVDTNVFMNEFEMTTKVISSVIGDNNNSKAVRYPGGHMSWSGAEEVDKLLETQGYYYVDWNCIIGDADSKKKDKESMLQIFNETKRDIAKNGDVVLLMHDTYGKEETAKALPDIIKELKDEGYEFDTIR